MPDRATLNLSRDEVHALAQLFRCVEAGRRASTLIDSAPLRSVRRKTVALERTTKGPDD